MKSRNEIKALVSNCFSLDEVTTPRIRKELALVANQHNLISNQHYQVVKNKSGTSKKFWQSVYEFV